ILDGEAVVPGGSYVAWRVPADQAASGVLVGELASVGAKNRFAVAVLTESDYVSWRKGYLATPLYTARQVDHVELNARLPKPDVYYVFVSNPQAVPNANTIRGTLSLRTAAASNAVASTASAPSHAVRRDLISFGVVLILAFALATWSIYEERKTQAVAV